MSTLPVALRAAILFLWAGLCWLGSAAEIRAADAPLLRESIAAVRLDQGQRLVVADRAGGRLTLIDVAEQKVIDEQTVGLRLTDVTLGDAGLLLVTDEGSHSLHAVEVNDERLEVLSATKVSEYPVGVRSFDGGRQAIVAGLWSRRLDFLRVDANSKTTPLRKVESLSLQFSPRRLLVLPDERHAVVTDAFGGKLAVVDLHTRQVVRSATLNAHNIYGLAWDDAEDRLLIAHQMLNSSLPITFDNVQWGVLMRNVVRVIEREQLLAKEIDLSNATRVISLGQDGEGSADPTAVLPLPEGGFAAIMGGVDQIALVEAAGLVNKRIAVGRRPIALLEGHAPHALLVVNQFSATIDVVHTGQNEPLVSITLAAPQTLDAVERGRRLFYDAQLSFEGWMSCHSCHTEGHTNGQLADTLGDGGFGAPKRTLTLLGTRDTDRWAWNAEIKELHEQVRKSIETSMHGEPKDEDVFDLTVYLHTLDPPPSFQPPRDRKDRAEIERGRRLFVELDCKRCHVPPLTYTSQDAYDVGLADAAGNRKFNPPSLRGVGHGPAYFHDNRASSLEDVFEVYGHQLDKPLSVNEQRSLLRFLRSL